jgi:hypothetical protein
LPAEVRDDIALAIDDRDVAMGSRGEELAGRVKGESGDRRRGGGEGRNSEKNECEGKKSAHG